MTKSISIKFFFIATLFFFIACKEDDGLTSTVNLIDELNGTWIITNIERTGNNCPDLGIFYLEDCSTNTAACIEAIMIFDDGNYSFSLKSYENGVLNEDLSFFEESIYTIEGNTITACDKNAPSECQTSTINLTIAGDALTSTNEEEITGCTQIVQARRL